MPRDSEVALTQCGTVGLWNLRLQPAPYCSINPHSLIATLDREELNALIEAVLAVKKQLDAELAQDIELAQAEEAAVAAYEYAVETGTAVDAREPFVQQEVDDDIPF